MSDGMRKTGRARYTALMGALLATSMAFAYLEAILPINIGIPGVKLGLANMTVIFALYRLKARDAVLLSLIRVLLSSILFGNVTVAAYSLCGAALSLLVMILLKLTDKFSEVGVSVAGGVAHNIGQLACAAALMENASLAWYLPVLAVSGCIFGALIGALGAIAVRRIKMNI